MPTSAAVSGTSIRLSPKLFFKTRKILIKRQHKKPSQRQWKISEIALSNTRKWWISSIKLGFRFSIQEVLTKPRRLHSSQRPLGPVKIIFIRGISRFSQHSRAMSIKLTCSRLRRSLSTNRLYQSRFFLKSSIKRKLWTWIKHFRWIRKNKNSICTGVNFLK